ncbi:helix-turn-helix transcriptional regulator (plasmid) [Streptosporangium sandarakinum]|uniref:helix-turn-helix transcriptional regulator n=1 Tax=Streptosporangium sandarakinum TaxID=1260955 RepID=UPI003D917E09
MSQPDETEDSLKTVKEVAAQLSVSPMTVYRLIHSGELPAVQPTPRTTRIRQSAVDALLAESAVTTDPGEDE